MRSTSTPTTLFIVALSIGAVVGVVPATAVADRPAPELLRTSLDSHGGMPTIVREVPRPSDQVRTRGTVSAPPGEADDLQSAMRQGADEPPGRPSGGTIRVSVHVITSDGDGIVSDGQIAEQIAVLNRDLADTGYRFELATVDRTENAMWFRMTPASAIEKQAKRALAIDPAHRLNLYTCSPPEARLHGLSCWTSLPSSMPEGDFTQGVVLDDAALPTGPTPNALSDAASHMVSQYLGAHALGIPGVLNGPYPLFRLTAQSIERIRAIVPVYRPSLVSEPVAPTVARAEIVPEAGAEPEDGRVLSYRGAFPNPFHAETALRFTLPASAAVSLRIYSVTGQLVRTLVDAQLPPGDHSAMFRADGLPSGAYFAVLKVGRVQMNRTLMLIR